MRAADRPGPQRGTDDARPLGEQLAQVELGLHPALHANDYQLAVGGQRVDIAVQVGRSHDVEDDVSAATIGLLLQPRDEILVAVVDGDLGAQVATELQFLR
ncbi:Uncharacterised protein [Mycobacterium tuberculosis]|uniref:Uncharacterized protein n=1 Tax=Mycobacterium tuberculosis TaxID=1773 RepID=A0A655AKV8_MYCTX|nr:Uncharacterised protein [Mycobacterium tuberculosis]CKT24574.1 Uncharacterised protein [Mycobacterium tuberculosis]CKW38801.1 Uncharacterised protein [Mycobacterium tuberculosis]CNV44980.1 Uncharacterised protein [Mycobacterium tuberculosis]CNV51878.1 Uncharacterised protein [Mycobacterium tuberculosis]